MFFVKNLSELVKEEMPDQSILFQIELTNTKIGRY